VDEDPFRDFNANAGMFELMHTWYEHAQAAGFTQAESLQLVGYIFAIMASLPRTYKETEDDPPT
jgi:hypothetical protein